MKQYLESKTNLKFNKLYDEVGKHKSKRFQIKKKDILQKFIQYMYKDATIYLYRKQEKCMKTINNYNEYMKEYKKK